MAEGIPTATNVHHVAVTVPDLEEAIEFFVDCLGAELLYRKGPFGGDGDTMERRLGVHADATASLAMLRCGPTTNVELFEWEAPGQNEEPPRLSDVGATHIGIRVEELDDAVEAIEDRDDAEVLDEPATNDDGPTEGLKYVFFRTDWGGYFELLEEPEQMPYEDETDSSLYGPAPSWDHRYETEPDALERRERLERAMEPTLNALDSALSLIDRSKETSVPLKGSVWELVASAVPGAESFESKARDLEAELRDWRDDTQKLDERLTELDDELGSGEPDYDTLADGFEDSVRSMESLKKRSERLEERLREASEKSDAVAEKAGGVPVLGDDIQKRFNSLSRHLSEAADEVVSTTMKPSDVFEVRRRSDDT
jgi:catechol 2,3-dioxygenase-like lactoylglutathione lyase family enzyme/archaellum component FlaC